MVRLMRAFRRQRGSSRRFTRNDKICENLSAPLPKCVSTSFGTSMTVEEAAFYEQPFEYVKKNVRSYFVRGFSSTTAQRGRG